jgi:hypothetical protein
MTVPLLYQAVARSRAVVKTVYADKFIIYLTEVSRLPPHQLGPNLIAVALASFGSSTVVGETSI